MQAVITASACDRQTQGRTDGQMDNMPLHEWPHIRMLEVTQHHRVVLIVRPATGTTCTRPVVDTRR